MLLLATGAMCAGRCVAADDGVDLALLQLLPPLPPPLAHYPRPPPDAATADFAAAALHASRAGVHSKPRVVCVGNHSARVAAACASRSGRVEVQVLSCAAPPPPCAQASSTWSPTAPMRALLSSRRCSTPRRDACLVPRARTASPRLAWGRCSTTRGRTQARARVCIGLALVSHNVCMALCVSRMPAAPIGLTRVYSNAWRCAFYNCVHKQETHVRPIARRYWGHSGAPLLDDAGALRGLHNSWDAERGTRHGVSAAQIADFLSTFLP